MTFDQALSQTIDMLRRNGRVSHRALRRQFSADEAFLDDLRAELVDVLRIATDDGGVLSLASPTRSDPDPGAVVRVSSPVSVAGASEAPPAVTEVSRLPKGERRHLAVAFCDLVGSTGLSAILDPEELGEIYRGWQDLIAGAVTRFGGHVANYLGDGSLLVFGYPVAHEDDPQRAVWAALAAQSGLTRLNAAPGAATGRPPLQARIGIHHGLVLLSDLGGAYALKQFTLGQTPNIAARLQTLAPAGGIVISATLKGLLGDLFAVEPMGEQALKGVAQPIETFRVLGPARRPSSPAASWKALHASEHLIGREAELATIKSAWQRVVEGVGQAILVTGVPGIGKSHLVAATRGLVETAGQIGLRCSALHTASALHPVIDHLRQEIGLDVDEPDAAAVDRLRDTLSGRIGTRDRERAVELLGPHLSLIPQRAFDPVHGTDTQHDRRALLDLMAHVLLAGDGPRLVVVEDLHWADPSTLELLGLVLERLPQLPVLVVMTARQEFRSEWPHRSELGRIALQRLSRRDSMALIETAARGQPLPAEVLEGILERGDGVPLFLEELVAMMREALAVGGGEDGLARAEGRVRDIPDTLQATLVARLDRLGDARNTAQLAAALGREFPEALLERFAALDAPTLRQHLDRLVEAEVLERRRGGDGTDYRFRHALIQDAAYQTMLRARRQSIHRGIAEALRSDLPGLFENQPEFAAHHLTEAGLADEGAERWLSAAERALRRSAGLEALRHVERGLQLIEEAEETAPRARLALALHVCKGSALLLSRGQSATEVGATFERARELTDRIGDGGSDALLPVLYGLWRFFLGRSALDHALDVAQRLAALASGAKDRSFACAGSMAVGLTLFNLGRIPEALTHLDACVVAHAALGGGDERSGVYLIGQNPLVVGLLARAVSLWLIGRSEQALADAAQAAAIAENTGLPFQIAVASAWIANLNQLRGDPIATLAAAERALALCVEHGYAMWEGASRALAAVARLESGADPEEQIQEIRRGDALLRSTGSDVLSTRNAALLARACLATGRFDDGLEAARQGLAAIGCHGERWWEPELHRLEGELLHARRPAATDEAEECFRAAAACARAIGVSVFERGAERSLASLLSGDAVNAA